MKWGTGENEEGRDGATGEAASKGCFVPRMMCENAFVAFKQVYVLYLSFSYVHRKSGRYCKSINKKKNMQVPYHPETMNTNMFCCSLIYYLFVYLFQN